MFFRGLSLSSDSKVTCQKKVARPARLELATLCLEDKLRCAISLLFLGSAYFLNHGFIRYSGAIGPKLDPIFPTAPLG